VSRPLVLAHRGARRRAPENTLAAFRAARDLGSDGIELDVRRTADGALAVHHNPQLADGSMIADLPLPELRTVKPDLASLPEVLDVARGMLVNIEIKNLPWEPGFDPDERAADDVVALIRSRDGRDNVLISSFHLPTIDRVRGHPGAPPTGFLCLASADFDVVPGLVAEKGHSALHPDRRGLRRRAGERLVASARAQGLRVNVWTVNKPNEMCRLAVMGVDGIVTDVPDVALNAL
jgi:glycerophosphoryl diester phosphodiesterase